MSIYLFFLSQDLVSDLCSCYVIKFSVIKMPIVKFQIARFNGKVNFH